MAKMRYEIKDMGGVKVLALFGSITMGGGDLTVRQETKNLLAENVKKIVIDLAKVPHLDSTGIGELVSAYTSARNQNAQIKLANLTAKIRDLMEITALSSVFESYETVKEAVASFD
jgi:anti-sigma B factor antagonist